MGRSKVDNPEIVNKMLKALASGASKEHAAQAAGVSHRAVQTWLNKADEANRPNRWTRFADKYNAAVAKGASVALDVIEDVMLDPEVPAAVRLKAATWRLEHRYANHYGSQSTIVHHGDPSAPLEARFEAFNYADGLEVAGDDTADTTG